jgi:hypothetical protein
VKRKNKGEMDMISANTVWSISVAFKGAAETDPLRSNIFVPCHIQLNPYRVILITLEHIAWADVLLELQKTQPGMPGTNGLARANAEGFSACAHLRTDANNGFDFQLMHPFIFSLGVSLGHP